MKLLKNMLERDSMRKSYEKWKRMLGDRRMRSLLKVFSVYILVLAIMLILYEYLPIVIKFSIFSDEGFYFSFLTNLCTGVVDFIFLTIIVRIMDSKYDKEDKIARYQEEIDNCRFWMSEEAAYKLYGNVRRLLEMNVNCFDLSKCMLSEIKLKDVELRKSKFMGANMKNTNFTNDSFEECDFQGCYCEASILKNTQFDSCNFKYLKADNVKAQSMHAKNCNFTRASLENAVLSNAILINCDFKNTNLKNADLHRANLKGAKNLTIEQLLECKDIMYITLDEEFYDDRRIKEKSKKEPR